MKVIHDYIDRLKSFTVPPNYPEIDIVRLINNKTFDNCVKNEIRCAMVSLMAKGITSATEIASALGMPRTAIYRHLNILRRSGIVVYRDGRFYVAARLFLVYDIEANEDGSIKMVIHTDKGGFIDETIGFVFVKGELCKCDACTVRDKCLNAVKNLAKRLDVKIRSENPLSCFKEIVEELIKRDVVKALKEGYLILKLPEEPSEEEESSVEDVEKK